MQLTRFSDYSLRVLIFLAHRHGAHTTIKDVSEAHRISRNHLMKVVQSLAQRGYVSAVRGKGGGIGLARDPAAISVGKVIRDTQPLATVECLEPGYRAGCRLYPQCRLRGALQTAQARFLATLDGFSIGDVMGSRPLVAQPARPAPRRRRAVH